MTIIVFLIDTSSSMNQRAYLGGRPTILDVAKGAVETFVKVRQRSPESRGDRYMLLTFEDPPANIKAGWKENLQTFMNELKNLHAVGMTTMGVALKNTFDILNINRMQTGIDTYGQGRCPFYLEPSVIVTITDGGKLSNTLGVQEELNLPMNSSLPGSELTKEPFRWDQRLFGLVLRLSGTPALERDIGLVPSDNSPIDSMCEVTGGRSYCITSHRMLMQCIDSLVQKVQSGVVINFEKIGPDPPPVTGDTKGEASGDVIVSDSEFKEEEMKEKGNNGRSSMNGNQAMGGGEGTGSDLPLGRPPLAVTQNGAIFGGTGDAGVGGLGSMGGPGLAGLAGGVIPHLATAPLPSQQMLQQQGPTSWHVCRKLIYVPRSAQKGFAVGYWPIPESFWPDINNVSLPARSAHPNVKFLCTSQEPMVIESLPFDKYELEPSPLTQYILSRKKPTTCWQVFVPNSFKNSEVGHPFGYLKASTNLACVNLFVMPYNYPLLLPLLDDLFKVHKLKPTNEWKAHFSNYLRTMPVYYAGPLRRAIARMGATALSQSLIPESMDNSLSYSVLNYLKRLKNQAKLEFDKLCNEVGKSKPNSVVEGIRVVSRSSLKKDLSSNPALQDKFMYLRDQMSEFPGFAVVVRGSGREMPTQSYRNAFDIPRRHLLDQVVRMRANFLQTSLRHIRLQDEDQLHSMPVGQMGNYQEYLKRAPSPLREIESVPVRQHMFGNPFKIDKRMMVDEADIDLVSGGGTMAQNPRGTKRPASDSGPIPFRMPKRKPGPLPRDVTVWRPSSPSLPSPPPSPSPSPPPSPLVVSLLQPAESAMDSEDASLPPPPILPPPLPSLPQPTQPAPPLPPLLPPTPPPPSSIRSRSPSPPNSYPYMYSPTNEMTNHVNHVDAGRLIDGIGDLHVPPISNRGTTPPPEEAMDGWVDSVQVKSNNQRLKEGAFKEVRRPGKNFQQILGLMRLVEGSLETRRSFVRDVIQESLRFKRKALAGLLEGELRLVEVNSTQRNNSTISMNSNSVLVASAGGPGMVVHGNSDAR